MSTIEQYQLRTVRTPKFFHSSQDPINLKISLRFLPRIDDILLTGENVLSSALVSVLVTDANDNAPIFEQKSYEFSVKEDARAGELMGKLFDYLKKI